MKHTPFILGTALLFSSALFIHSELFYGEEVTTSGKYKMTYEVDGQVENAIVEVKENQTELLLKDIVIEQNEKWSPIDNVVSLTDKDGEPLNIDKVTIKNNVNTQEVGIYFVKFTYGNYVSVARVSVSQLIRSEGKKRVINRMNDYSKNSSQIKVMLNDELLKKQSARKKTNVDISGGAEINATGFGNMLSFLSGTLLYGTRRV